MIDPMTCADYMAAVTRGQWTPAELRACCDHRDICAGCAAWTGVMAIERANRQTAAQQARSAAEGLARAIDLTRREREGEELRT